MRSFFVLAALTLAACSTPTDSVKPPAAFGNSLGVTGTSQAANNVSSWSPTVFTAGAGSLSATGLYVMGNGCSIDLVFGGFRSNDTLVFQVYHQLNPSSGQVCADIISYWSFEATASPLPAGKYTILTQRPDASWQWMTIQTDTITIP